MNSSVNNMHCEKCGNELTTKFLEYEGMVPFCENCNEYRFMSFNSAVSAFIFNPNMTKVLLIKQYNTDFFRLVAGYVNKGESLEQTLYRELGEEIGRIPMEFTFNKSEYFEKSNTLISNFIVKLTSEDIFPNHEIDYYEWINVEDVSKNLDNAKLAKKLWIYYLNKNK